MYCSQKILCRLFPFLVALSSFSQQNVVGFPKTRSTTVNPDHICPPSADKSKPFRYHIGTSECHKVKTTGPCQNNLKFYQLEDAKQYGDCDCPITSSDVPWIYHSETEKCYKAYDQAYCASGQWLVFDEDDIPKCDTNKCVEKMKSSNSKIVLYNGQCVELWESSNLCKSNEIISFDTNDIRAMCLRNDSSETADYNLGQVGQLKCKIGSRRDIVGKCRDKIKSQFGG